MNFSISNEEQQALNDVSSVAFPKYTSQLINWANQNAQGTRPKVVGQLSDLFPDMRHKRKMFQLKIGRICILKNIPMQLRMLLTKFSPKLKT